MLYDRFDGRALPVRDAVELSIRSGYVEPIGTLSHLLDQLVSRGALHERDVAAVLDPHRIRIGAAPAPDSLADPSPAALEHVAA